MLLKTFTSHIRVDFQQEKKRNRACTTRSFYFFHFPLERSLRIFEISVFPFAVGRGQYRRVSSARAVLGRLPFGHICERGDAEGVLDWRADEVQERLQIQNRVRGAADGDGAAAGLRQWRVGPYQSYQIIRTYTYHSSGRSTDENRSAYRCNGRKIDISA